MGTITTFYVAAFSYFFHRVSRVFAQAFAIYIFRFFPLGFSKIVFILCDVQVLKGECYKIYVWVITFIDKHRQLSGAAMRDGRLACPLAEPLHPSPPRPLEWSSYMYKRIE
jgi:hypothetical protein